MPEEIEVTREQLLMRDRVINFFSNQGGYKVTLRKESPDALANWVAKRMLGRKPKHREQKLLFRTVKHMFTAKELVWEGSACRLADELRKKRQTKDSPQQYTNRRLARAMAA